MSDLFAGVYGARFPEVVMNSGPLPPEGGLPAPLHDTPDSRINYGSTLLGDLQPYAYGEAGYMSSQSQNNQPHRIQKIIPELYLPEPNGRDVFKLSHAVDDSDLAFVMRLNRHSIFCTGSRTSSRRSTKIGTSVDPLINLPTLNYLLAGLQTSMPLQPDSNSLWWEFLYNLDPRYWPKQDAENGRNYNSDLSAVELPSGIVRLLNARGIRKIDNFIMPTGNARPFCLDDIVHVIRNCIKPFGIVRGSEKQGGQHEMSQGPVSWAVPAIATLVIDGKEANVINLWHKKDLHAGEDLVLRLKLMPLKTYTLNHYYKGFARRNFDSRGTKYVWQLVPDVFNMEISDKAQEELEKFQSLARSNDEKRDYNMIQLGFLRDFPPRSLNRNDADYLADCSWIHFVSPRFIPDASYIIPWQELGYWHIGRSQIRRSESGQSDFYNDDMANNLRTNHIDITFQPVFQCLPRIRQFSGIAGIPGLIPCTLVGKSVNAPTPTWSPQLGLEHITHKRPKVSFDCNQRYLFQDASCHASVDLDEGSSFEPYEHQPALDFSFSSGPKAALFELGDSDISLDAQGMEATAPVAVPSAGEDFGEAGPVQQQDSERPPAVSEISEASREQLLSGLDPVKAAKPVAKGRGRKGGETTAARGPVEGTLLRPGAAPESCQMELL